MEIVVQLVNFAWDNCLLLLIEFSVSVKLGLNSLRSLAIFH